MTAHSIQFNSHSICDAHIEDKNLIIYNYDEKRLFAIHLYIKFTINRTDFMRNHHKNGSEIRFPLRSSDVILLIKHGFKFYEN